MIDHSSPGSTITDRFRSLAKLLPKDDWLVAGWVLATKALLFWFGFVAWRVLENKPVPKAHAYLDIWNRWDSLHYQRIAQFGYSSTDSLKSWFYPFFPWMTRVFAFVTRDYLVAAFAVSAVSLAVAAILLRRLIAIDFRAPIALRTVWFFLIFPTAHFLHVGYTESLFLAFAFGSLFSARTDRWWLAGLLGGLAWMTRANGMILFPALAVEATHRLWTTRKWDWRWLWILCVPAGFCVYLLVNWHVTGDPFWFLAARRQLFSLWPAWPWHAIHELIGNMHRGPSDGEIVGVQEFIFTILGLVCAVVAWFKMRPAYAIWITGNWLLVCSINFVGGVPRYSLSMFPIFVLFAIAARHRLWFAVITVWSILFLSLFCGQFVRGWWAF